jgi:hypothetical protein
MYVLPLCLPNLLSRFKIRGRVQYSDDRQEIPPFAAEDDFGDHFNYFMDLIASNSAPPRAPSIPECRFCEITKADCPERMEEKPIELG